jgi:signal transduction histidine kinase
MRIRTRLTLWYAGILFGSALLIAAWSYYELVTEKRKPRDAVEASEGSDEGEGFNDALDILLWCGVPAALIGLAGGWFLMRRALNPIQALTAAAGQVDESNLHRQLPRTGNGDELDRLTEVFNAMTARLSDSFQRVREFTLHASHELKTPLTVLRGQLETALNEPALTPAQRELATDQLDEHDRLTKIVDGLSLLTKADAGQVELRREPIRLDELVCDAYADAQVLARPSNISVTLEHCDPVTINGDRHRLRQLLLNLTDNAVKYNQPGGTVTLALVRAGPSAEIKVGNTGAGIPPESLPRVFDRFFRADTSHGKSVEGCGLGLSIAQWIVTAHGGTIQMTSEPGRLTTVVVRLPASA